MPGDYDDAHAEGLAFGFAAHEYARRAMEAQLRAERAAPAPPPVPPTPAEGAP